MSLHKTYILDSKETLHDWNNKKGYTNACAEFFGKKVYRAETSTDQEFDLLNQYKAVENGDIVDITVTVVLKGKKRKGFKNPFKLTINDNNHKCEVLEKFCSVKETGSGLKLIPKEEAHSSKLVKVEQLHDLFIHGKQQVNTYKITGKFEVADAKLFTEKYNNGIGGRKSYGYGMIVILKLNKPN